MLSGTPALMECKNRVQRLNRSRFANVLPIQKIAPTMPHYLASVLNKSMALEPNRRYQSPGEYLADLEMVAHRLAEDPTEAPAAPVEERPQPLTATGDEEEPRHAVMIVESNARMQDMLRDGLKKAGYRVLLTSSPERALDRIGEQPDAADCLVLDAQELGESALDAFNRLDDDGTTRALPAILLLEREQRAWRRRAKTSKHRLVLFLPITLGQLRDKLKELIPLAAAADAGRQPSQA
jgi:serine/threonine-protein kinase